MVAHVRMVASEHEYCMLEPGLPAGSIKELANGHIRIADTFLNRKMLLGELCPILLRNGEGMMAGSREDGRHEWFLHLSHLLGIILQERFVPDSPRAVEIGRSFCGLILCASVIVLEACFLGKCLEAHRSVLRPMEEGGLIALSP